jgi:MoaA/NifB/PqqE/SkfB family radical SAM enzyme
MLKDSFCSSPWFHLRITHNGDFESCRWSKTINGDSNISSTTVMQYYNSTSMKQLRNNMLDGNAVEGCANCYYEEKFDKLSGRRRQLLKSAIDVNNFAYTTRSSPHYDKFLYSSVNDGLANHYPTDLQIDLGNICNSACIMCGPSSSSLLTQDYKKLFKINPVQFSDPTPYNSWTRDPVILDRVVNEIASIPNLRYIHFLGGETLYDPAFYTICERLITAGVAKNIIVGTTTNGTLYDERIEYLIKQFKEFHLGISIESVTSLNDYIRYPGKIDSIKNNIERFLELRNDSKLYISLRITPNVFTISEIDLVFEYMIKNNVIAESCNILHSPRWLRIELLPEDIKLDTIAKLQNLIDRYGLEKHNTTNIRRSDLIPSVIADTVIDYYTLLQNYNPLPDAAELGTQLVSFLKGFETLRKNTILDYAPRYTDFLRHNGY